MTETDLLSRIQINPTIFGGKPIMRGLRIAVEHILGMLAAGESHEALFQEKPSDLFMTDGSKISAAMLPHIVVAYGLSNFATDLPKAEAPSDVPPMQPDLSPKLFKPFLEMDEWRWG